MNDNIGVSSQYLTKLASWCLKIKPQILPCDIFQSESQLAVDKSFIVNLQKSDLPGSHYVCILIKSDKIYYFDSLAFPIVNSYIDTKLQTFNKDIYVSTKAIQGADSVFCGLYCIAFLVICQNRKKSFEEFLNMFSFDSPQCYTKNEEECTRIIQSSLTLS